MLEPEQVKLELSVQEQRMPHTHARRFFALAKYEQRGAVSKLLAKRLLRALLGYQPSERETAIFLNVTYKKSKALLRWNPELQTAVEAMRELAEACDKRGFKPAFELCCDLYIASRHAYKKLSAATCEYAFFHIRRSSLVLAPTEQMQKLDAIIAERKGPVGTALLHMAWEKVRTQP